MSFSDVLIVGGGPAGLSAALTLVRQRHTVKLFDIDDCRAYPSARLHGVSGSDHKAPADNLNHSRAELKPYNTYTPIAAEVTKLAQVDGGFEATDSTGKTHLGKKVILANGVESKFPDIPGYAEAWGKGIFHNLFAQAYQEDPSKVHAGVLAVDWIAMPQFTFHMSHMTSQLAGSVTIYTHGNEELAKQIAPTLEGKPWKADTRKIAQISLMSPDGTAVDITFEDGSAAAAEAFLGHAPMTQVRGAFQEQLGLRMGQTPGEYETHGFFQETSVKGVYAAGDAMSMFKVWPNAIASGAQAAAGVAVKLQEEKWSLPPIFP
ncbi:hypothetical protein KVR01_002013 [Diaporthe batatas]|uniref:uncharacterized protein n=1 Tax=Diaporthe batatas TaxID=748121 RepID=UPI001D04020F|nr:uncharacterized protein KVR01_002013 [Diaporthe batatas]KAG8166324.1 hypothetical protein KVR01_002013 [Diaporthe batatas]